MRSIVDLLNGVNSTSSQYCLYQMVWDVWKALVNKQFFDANVSSTTLFKNMKLYVYQQDNLNLWNISRSAEGFLKAFCNEYFLDTSITSATVV